MDKNRVKPVKDDTITKTYDSINSTRQPWQWHSAGGQFLRERWWLRIFRVDRKLTYELGHHSVPCGMHQRTRNDAQSLIRRDLCHRPTKGNLQLNRWARKYRACQCWDLPDQKQLRWWHHTAARHPEILAKIISDRHTGHPEQASTTPLNWFRRRHHTSAHWRPPGCPPPRIQRHALWGLPVWGAPKSWNPSGWKNHRGW